MAPQKKGNTASKGRSKAASSRPPLKKKPTGTSKSSKTKSNNTPKRDAAFYELYNEIILLVTLVVAILLFLSNFGLGGKAGNAVNSVMFGLFGILGYLFPVMLFFGVAFFLANRGNRALLIKFFYLCCMLFMLAAICQLLTKAGNFAELRAYYDYGKTGKKGGGFVGGLICWLFVPLFGKVGSFLVTVAIFLACFMLFSRKAIFALLAKKSKERYELHKVHADERHEMFEQKQAERERMAAEKRRRIEEHRAQTFLLSEDEKKKNASGTTLPSENASETAEKVPEKKEKKRNFFGGITPTGTRTFGEGTRENQSSLTDMKESQLPTETVTEVRDIYEEEKKKRKKEDSNTLHMLEISPETGEYKNTAGSGERVAEKTPARKITGASTNVVPKGPTVAEQLMALGRNEDRQVSGATVFRDETPVNYDATPVEDDGMQQALSKMNEMKSSGGKKNASSNTSANTSAKSAVAKEGEVIEVTPVETKPEYCFPPIDLLTEPKPSKGVSQNDLSDTADKLEETFRSFGINVTVTNVSCGPAVTRYELLPEQGVRVSKITSLADDIKLSLAAPDIRIEAPIPGKSAVGIEVPNKENSTVFLRELLESKEFKDHSSKVAFAVGKDIGGQTVVTDIAKMPHLLIAGATGSGKSVCINTLIMSILYKADPKDVKLIMVDPKVVELSVYNGIPHLLIPVVTDPKKANAALNWAVSEMTDRYQKFAELGVRDIKGFNERVENAKKEGLEEEKYQKLPQIVIIVDELADLMMVAPNDVETSICRLAQLARAAGLHLVIATQRPSVNVITGVIKANIPSRIAFAVSSSVDSRTILDGSGAEKLLGKGDMLFFPSGFPKPVRVQGAFVSDGEVNDVVEFLKAQCDGSNISTEVTEKIENMPGGGANGSDGSDSDRDEFFADAGRLIIDKDKASIGMLQRAYKIGFNRAARIMDQLAQAGVVGPEEGTKPRKILMTPEEFENYLER